MKFVFWHSTLLIPYVYGIKHNLLIILKFVHLHSTHNLSVLYSRSKHDSLCDETREKGIDINFILLYITLSPVRQEEKPRHENVATWAPIHRYGETNTTRIMMTNVRHVSA